MKARAGSAEVGALVFRRRFRGLLLLPFLLILLNAWLAWHALNRFVTAQHWLAHTLEVQRQTLEVRTELALANSAARGYMLVRSEEYQHRYAEASSRTFGALVRLQSLTVDNAGQQERIALLRQRVAERFRTLDRAVSAAKQGPLPQSLVQATVQDGADGGVTLRSLVLQVLGEEDRLLALRYAEASSARTAVVVSILVATVLDIALLSLTLLLLFRAVQGREALQERALVIEALNDQLSSLNTGLELKVAERTRELELSNQELQAFSYSVSHDLRAPLRTIDGFSLALEEDFAEVLNDEGRDYIRRVRSGVQRMGTLIDALLQLSRVTRSEVQRERVDLSELARTIFNELMVNEPGRTVDFTAQEGLIAEVDPRLMRVAFENLIGNAIKFSSKVSDPHIHFGSMDGEATPVYVMRDNGAGFDMKYVDRLFTAFQRLHGDKDFKGSGIGLATVSRIVRRHHGTIWAESAQGAGATFFFTLQG